MDFGYILSIVLLALGFGFVIFWHELGHFLAAKWAGVKVEQFAVGFGTAALAWRKGIGVRPGSTRREYEKRCREYLEKHGEGLKTTGEVVEAATEDQRLDAAGRALGLGETEYRLNCLPLGGYVKMLGQDDLNPNSQVSDPRAYNMQPIPKRMVIVSAGVVMNIILAAIGFFLLFLYGFNAPPAIVGQLAPLSPAQRAGLNVGDRILTIDGEPQADFTKIQLNVALMKEGEEVKVTYLPAGAPKDSTDVRTTTLKPDRSGLDAHGMLAIGVSPPVQLEAIDATKVSNLDTLLDPKRVSPLMTTVRPGDTIVAVAGAAIPKDEVASGYWRLDQVLQASDGKPFNISVRDVSGKVEDRTVVPTLDTPFSDRDVDFAGMRPRSAVLSVSEDSPALGELQPDDVIVSVAHANGDATPQPSRQALMEALSRAGKADQPVTITVLRGNETKTLKAIVPNLTVNRKEARKGLGVALIGDEGHAVVGAVEEKSPAGRAGIPQGSTIVSVSGKPVNDWHEVLAILRTSKLGQVVPVAARTSAGESTFQLTLDESSIETLKNYRYAFLPAEPGSGLLKDYTEVRTTKNPIEAAQWGVQETRDLILQFYLTLKRMFQGSVPASNLMGPVGIAKAGANFAYRGNDWLLWFLSMISANLAVVNFLPIPIVDGGLFLFLVIEKLQGRPLSPRTQSIAQVIGLALILSVFVFVTYQDIMR